MPAAVLALLASSSDLEITRRRLAGAGDRFCMVQAPMESADLSPVLPAGGADLVLAMGSMQYTPHPGATLRRLAAWARPGGSVLVLVDSLVARVVELIDAGATAEAVQRSSRACTPTCI